MPEIPILTAVFTGFDVPELSQSLVTISSKQIFICSETHLIF